MSPILNEGTISHSVIPYDRLEWTIGDFLSRSGEPIESPDHRIEESVWHMAVLSNDISLKEFLSLNVWRKKTTPYTYIIRAGIKRKNRKTSMMVLSELDDNGFRQLWKFLPSNEVSEINDQNFPDGSLTVVCEIGSERTDGKESNAESPLTNPLIENLKDLFLGGQHSDAIIKVEDKKFKVHRAILGARSPVFARMFEHDMKEGNSGVVDIPDCSAEAFEAFLHYLYTGKVDGCTSDTVFDLYYAADKYATQYLKENCLKFMMNGISADNFCDVFTLSLSHDEKKLQEMATRYFCENLKVIIKTVKWQTFVKENPIQANELFIKAVGA